MTFNRVFSVVSMACATVLGAVSAQADSVGGDWHLGWGTSHVSEELSRSQAFADEDSEYNGLFSMGYNINRYFGIEVEALRVDDFRLFGRVMWPISERAEFYIRGGAITQSAFDGDSSDFMPAAGLGFRYYITRNFGFNLGYDYSEKSFRGNYLQFNQDNTDYEILRGDVDLQQDIFNATLQWKF
ncbi:outer membrane protein [Halioxenophilus aromaticivorans]|uniref:Outer membrane protein beta-barrel domain-containing protein n=1 Tax=Halioxenophilus aromaticivorans TaxID=1306992 RepID=A0AAV3U3Y1_9ALTE